MFTYYMQIEPFETSDHFYQSLILSNFVNKVVP